MTPAVSLYVYFVGPLLLCFGILLWVTKDFFQPEGERVKSRRTNAVIAVVACVGIVFIYSLHSDNSAGSKEAATPSFIEANAAVLAKAEADDLLLCTHPESRQIVYAFLIESTDRHNGRQWLHGYFLNKQSLIRTNGGITAPFFDKCELDSFGYPYETDRRTRMVGHIIIHGLDKTPVN